MAICKDINSQVTYSLENNRNKSSQRSSIITHSLEMGQKNEIKTTMEFRELRSEASTTLQIFLSCKRRVDVILNKKRAKTFHDPLQRVGKVKYSFTSTSTIKIRMESPVFVVGLKLNS